MEYELHFLLLLSKLKFILKYIYFFLFYRKHWFSYNCLAVVNANTLFIFFECRWPGSVNDKRLVNNSSLKRSRFIPNNAYILADAGFALNAKCIVPFTGRLEHDAILYNHLHSSTRIIVEHTFGLWKARFRAIGTEIFTNPEDAP